MKNDLFASLVAATVFVATVPASAEEIVINFASTSAPQSSTVRLGVQPLADKINAMGKGVIRVEVKNGGTIANHVNYYQRTLDDVVQMAYGTHPNTPGKFPRSSVVDLPFNADECEPAAVALWRLYKTGLLNEEYTEIVPALLFVFPQNGVHLRGEVKSFDTLEGLKLSTSGKVTSEIITRLGGTPISLPIIEVYEGVQRGTINGFLLPWPVFPSFKFGEVAKFHIDTTLGTNGAMVMMARKKFDSLPAEARRILEANFGEAESRRWGKYYDDQRALGRKMVADAGGHSIVKPSTATLAKWSAKLKPIADDWIARTPNGRKIYDTWVKLRTEAEAGK